MNELGQGFWRSGFVLMLLLPSSKLSKVTPKKFGNKYSPPDAPNGPLPSSVTQLESKVQASY